MIYLHLDGCDFHEGDDGREVLHIILDHYPAAVLWPKYFNGPDRVDCELFIDRFAWRAWADAPIVKNRLPDNRRAGDIGSLSADPDNFIYLSQHLFHNFTGPRPQYGGV